MKSERRHKLEQNYLADWLAKQIEAVKPYANVILGVTLLLVVGLVWYSWSSARADSRRKEGWDQFFNLLTDRNLNPAEFEDIVKDYPETKLAHWSAIMAADLRLAIGCNAMFSNKPTANQELRDAVELYRLILDESGDSMLRERATYGLARTLESQMGLASQGDADKAIKRYQEVKTNWPNGAYAAAATIRLEDLQRESTKSFYDRFAQFNPETAYSDQPGEPGKRPLFDLDSLSDEPVFDPGTFNFDSGKTGEEPSSDAPENSTDASPDAAEPAAAGANDTNPAGTGPAATDANDGDPADADPAAKETGASPPPDNNAADSGESKSADSADTSAQRE